MNLKERIKEILKLFGDKAVIVGRIAIYIHLGELYYMTKDLDVNFLPELRRWMSWSRSLKQDS